MCAEPHMAAKITVPSLSFRRRTKRMMSDSLFLPLLTAEEKFKRGQNHCSVPKNLCFGPLIILHFLWKKVRAHFSQDFSASESTLGSRPLCHVACRRKTSLLFVAREMQIWLRFSWQALLGFVQQKERRMSAVFAV